MSRLARLACTAWMAFTFPTVARASTIYADGLTHTVNSSSADIIVSNATTLNVTTGAAIVGAAATSQSPAVPGISATQNSIINVTGGTITGGSGANVTSGAVGLSTTSSTVNITGGTITGGNAIGVGTGEPGLDFFSTANSLTISGGTIQGGSEPHSSTGGTPGAIFDLEGSSATAMISGGNFIGGTATGSNLGPAMEVYGVSGASMTISGGQFTGGQFGANYPGETLVTLYDGGSLKFVGTNISFSPIIPGEPYALVTGTYLDGSQLSISLYLTFPVILTETLTSLTLTAPVIVPEPPSFLLNALGLLGVAAIAWRFRRPSHFNPGY
jgi:hypothetical protein